ncbi:MAG: adenine deaminase [Phascolarctobacterium sp.]|nr:adenine deaminase [Phascolarctobacterium sp.]
MSEHIRAVALGEAPADVLIKNGKVVNVLTGEIYLANVAIADDVIAGVGDYKFGKEVIDATGKYILPGFINTHCHVESSMATPESYCIEELRWGVTTLITDPHEIANVAGVKGIKYMLDATRNLPINYYVQVPSCVPATPFEHAGCILDSKAMTELIDLEGVLGLGEMMNVPGVINGVPDVLAKLDLFKHKILDGHAPLLGGKALQAYASYGIETDHESISWAEVKEKLRAGIAILVREGSASRNLTAIIQGLLADGIDSTRLAFCTDDKHLADIRREGTIRYCVQQAIDLGLEPVRAIQMATINAAKIFGMRKVGAIAPGWQADVLVVDNLFSLKMEHVFHKGYDVLAKLASVKPITPDASLSGSVNVAPFSEAAFDPAQFDVDREYPVIEILSGQIVTERGSVHGKDIARKLKEGKLCMLAVIERHHATGNIGIGLLRGYGLKNGAAATTVAHDSHNLIVAGTNASDMFMAAQELIRVQGGYTLVKDGEVVDTLPLPICGLMSDAPADELTVRLEEISAKAWEMSVSRDIDAYITLSFMALPVIPKLRVTDMGVFDAEKFEFVN